MRVSISVATTPSAMPQIMFAGHFEDHCRLLAAMGNEGVDLFFPNPRDADAEAARKILDGCGLRATMLAAAGDIMADGLFLNDPSRRAELLERSRPHLEMAAQLGAMPNVGFLRGRHGKRPGESLRHMAEGLAAYCELAQTMGVDVLLEPICRYEIDSILTTDQAIELCTLAGSPSNLGLLLDLFHMNIEEPSVCGAICRAGTLIRHVHFVDNTRAVPGMGCLNLQDVVACLKAVGYAGFLGIEAVPGPDPEEKARRGLAFTRTLLNAAP